MSGFAKKDHLGRTSDFELGIWRESTSDELPFALYCAALACSVAEIAQSVEWQEVCFRENGPKHLLPVKTVNSAYCRVTNDIIASMADSAQHTVSFTAVYLMWTSPETSSNYGGFFWKASRSQRDGAELRC